jgi:hypothetical protein
MLSNGGGAVQIAAESCATLQSCMAFVSFPTSW